MLSIQQNQKEFTVLFIYEVYFAVNGKHQLAYNWKSYKHPKIEDIHKVAKKLNLHLLKIFNSEGVQIGEDDLPYLQNQEHLYLSEKKQFDFSSRLSQYDLHQLIGEGGFGKVYKAIHRFNKQTFAIKIVNANTISNTNYIDMMFRQAEILKGLNHPHIITLHYCYTLKTMEIIFIMQYLRGGDLRNYIANNILDQQKAKYIMVQIFEAVLYCHSMRIIHRDLKLENILLVNNNQLNVKVADFGISGLMSVQNSNIKFGTFEYLPPEIVLGNEKGFFPEADIWSCGIILYNLICGEMPFSCQNQIINCNEVLKKKVMQANVKISQQLNELLGRMLQFDKKRRIVIEEVLEHQWIKKYRNKMYYIIIEFSSKNLHEQILFVQKYKYNT